MITLNHKSTDISLDLAIRAHNGTSWVPEKRGKSVVDSYVAHLDGVVEEFDKWATDENRAEIEADLERYRQGYIKHLTAYLHSHSNVISAAIVGPAKFPTRRNQKRSRWADNKCNAWLAYSKKVLEKLRRKYDPRRIANAPILSDDGEAITKLEAKIKKAEEYQELMKAANKIARKKIGDDEKLTLLVDLGLKEASARKVLEPNYMGKIGFPSWQLSNNNANIRRMKQRVEGLKITQKQETTSREINGGIEIIENTELHRIQIIFPDKPDYETRKILKSNGFRWAPSQGAWQRHLNSNGRWAVDRVLKVVGEGKPV